MPFTLKIRHGDVAPPGTGVDTSGLGEDDLGKVGFRFASNELPDDYRFSRMGGWSPPIRASVVRVAFFKLLGTGLAAAFLALSPYTGRFTAWSLAVSAAVNLVACSHYWYIWQIRLQTYRSPRYDSWMARIGRAPAEDQGLIAKEAEHDARAIYFQEVTVDGLRYVAFPHSCAVRRFLTGGSFVSLFSAGTATGW